jgi:hypothetical protein
MRHNIIEIIISVLGLLLGTHNIRHSQVCLSFLSGAVSDGRLFMVEIRT